MEKVGHYQEKARLITVVRNELSGERLKGEYTMPINVACPSCKQKLKAPDAAAGRKLKCPKCGKPIGILGQINAPGGATALTSPIPAEQNVEDLAAAFLSEEAEKPPIRSRYSVGEPRSIKDEIPSLAATPWRPGADFRQPTEPEVRPAAGNAPRMLLGGGIGLAIILLSAGAFLVYQIHSQNEAQRQVNEERTRRATLKKQAEEHRNHAEIAAQQEAVLQARKAEKVRQIARFMAKWQDKIAGDLHTIQRQMDIERGRQQTANDLFNGTISPFVAARPPYVSQEERFYHSLLPEYQGTLCKASLADIDEILRRLKAAFDSGQKPPMQLK